MAFWGMVDMSELIGMSLSMNGAETPQVVQRLSALDNLFEATGVAAIKVMRGGKEQTLELPIQSVDNEMVEGLVRPYRPRVPVKRELIAGKWTSMVNEYDQEYQDKLAEYNRILSYVLVFCGLSIDIIDELQQVVWSADNQIHDIDAARRVVRKMGLVDNHIVTIMRAIRELTTEIEEQQAQE